MPFFDFFKKNIKIMDDAFTKDDEHISKLWRLHVRILVTKRSY